MDQNSDSSRFLRQLRSSLTPRIITIIVAVLLVLCTSGIIVYSTAKKDVTLIDDEKVLKVSTFKDSVQEVLKENKITLSPKDKVMPDLNKTIGNKSTILIKRAIPLVIKDGKQAKTVFTDKSTVAEVLEEQNIALNEKDKLNVDLTKGLIKNLLIQITRVTEGTFVENKPITYAYAERNTTAISRGQKRVVKEGQNGVKQLVYNATYENGIIVDKSLVKETVAKKPVSGIVEVGVEPRVVASRSGDLRYSQEIVMTASAYTSGFESTGKNPGDNGYGRTATGMVAQYGVVAVDPSVIPLGSKLYIESLDGFPSYGYAVAADKGSAIKGNRIDLFYETLSDAKRFGRRNVKVYVIE